MSSADKIGPHYYTHDPHMVTRRWLINDGHYSVFEAGTQVVPKSRHLSINFATLFLGVHYVGDRLEQDGSLLVPLVIDSLKAHPDFRVYQLPMYRRIRLQILRMQRLPYPLPGSKYDAYERYFRGSQMLAQVTVKHDNAELFDPAKWEIRHGTLDWYCRDPRRCRSSFHW